MNWSTFFIFLTGTFAGQCLGNQCGSKEYGTQQSPGKSCADILKRRADSCPDGVYWIALDSAVTETFPVYCDMMSGGWTLVFKGIAGVPGRIAGYWKLSYPSFEYSLGALNKENFFKHHYKNRIVQNWSAFKPQEARVVIYNQTEEKMVLRFDARGSDNLNWFSAAKLREAPWEDILKAKKNYFVIEGPCWSGKCRDFHINSVYGGCPNDLGWLSVGDSRACKWENRLPEDVILYSKRATFINYNKYADVGSGNVFAVYLR